jgi:hypothetical protein
MSWKCVNCGTSNPEGEENCVACNADSPSKLVDAADASLREETTQVDYSGSKNIAGALAFLGKLQIYAAPLVAFILLDLVYEGWWIIWILVSEILSGLICILLARVALAQFEIAENSREALSLYKKTSSAK